MKARSRTPLQQAVGLLSRREHSQQELRRKLVRSGADAEQADAALRRLSEAGLQDERRFAESLLRTRLAAGYGPLYLRAELQTHGLAAELIAAVLEAAEVDWTERASELLARRFPQGLTDAKARQRAQALLMRRGFDADCIRTASTSHRLG